MSADNLRTITRNRRRKVVVVGAGFAGISVVRVLRHSEAEVTLVDRNNHHLFQPFLFQVATSILEPAQIATPIRSLVSDMPNVRVEMREAMRIDMSRRAVILNEGANLPYDILVVATGAQTSYFGHDFGMGAKRARIEEPCRCNCRPEQALESVRACRDGNGPDETGTLYDRDRRRGRADGRGDYRHA